MNKMAKMMILNKKDHQKGNTDIDWTLPIIGLMMAAAAYNPSSEDKHWPEEKHWDGEHRDRSYHEREGREHERHEDHPAMDHKLDEETAKEWTQHMENADGTKGPHWSMDQVKQVAAQKNISEDPLDFWVAINMMYSDYCVMAKKHNVNTVDFYVDMAKAFLDDKDAKPDKLGRYYHAVVK